MWFGIVSLVGAGAKLLSRLGVWSYLAQVKECLRHCLLALAIGTGLLVVGLGLLAEHFAYRAPNF